MNKILVLITLSDSGIDIIKSNPELPKNEMKFVNQWKQENILESFFISVPTKNAVLIFQNINETRTKELNLEIKVKLMHKLIILLIISNLTFAQKKQTLDLADLFNKGKITAINRELKSVTENGKSFIQLTDNKEEGLVWLPTKGFKNGKIIIKMRGKDVFQRSFIGVAFHGLNDSTYDAVYCRPFNFFAKDSIRKIHAIQYISHPIFTWKKLREERNGVFEKEIISPPNPNDWFMMTINIDKKSVKAFINQDTIPSLVVEKLNNRNSGKLGIFVGDGAGGDFEQIIIESL